jgi:ubiquitin-conjugating enzyme E2 H
MRFKIAIADSFHESEYVIKYASKEAADEAGEDSESDEEMSSVGSYASGEDEEPAGNMEEL